MEVYNNILERFSKENINKLVEVPTHGIMSTIRHYAGFIIDFSGLIATALILIVNQFLGIEIILYLLPITLLIQLYFLYIIFIKFYKIKVNRYNIDLGLKKDVSFVFVSDFHVGYEYTSTNKIRLKRIIKKINSLNLDTLVLGGDFLTEKLAPDLISEFKELNAKNQIAVFGNHDTLYLYPKIEDQIPNEFLNLFKETKISFLINQSKLVKIDEVDILFGGIPDLYSKNFNIDKTFEESKKKFPKVLISHNPDIIDFVRSTDNIDLILSGHNHSGQIYFPFFGAILPMPTKRNWLTKGVFQINKKTKLLLSQGVGYSGSRLRINTEAEICVVTLG